MRGILQIAKLRLVGTLVVVLAAFVVLNFPVSAANFSNSYLRFSRMSATAASTLRLVFTVPAGNSLTEDHIVLGFPDDFTIATTGLTAASATCATETGATALPGTLTATGDNTTSSKNITVGGVTDLAASTAYCVDIDRTSTNDPVTNPSAGIYIVTVDTQESDNDPIDSTMLGARFVTDDQIIVNAVVPPSFNFVLDGNSADFVSNLDSGAIGYTAPRTVTITTNASQGWIAWARDSNIGLTSAAAGHTIASTTPGTDATISAGTEGYLLGVQASDAANGGAVTVETAYQGTGADGDGSGLDTNFRQIASSDGTADGDVLTLIGKATINGFTPAGLDYTDTWTIIGAGSF